MKAKNISLFIVLFGVLQLTFCKKDANLMKEPEVESHLSDFETTSATVYEDGGITLEGKINQLSVKYTQYGFIMASDSLLKNNVRFYRQATAPIPGTFKQDIFQNIETDKKYFYATYAVDDSLRYKFFDIKSFVANGVKRIKVDSISPLTAHLGDTITIYGKYLSGRFLQFNIGGTSTYAILTNDSVAKFIVPDHQNISSILAVSYDNRLDTISDRFALHKPSISTFTSNRTFRDTVTISGDHFDVRAEKNIVKFGTIPAQVISSTRKELKVRVPDDISSTQNTITVLAMLQQTSASSEFVLKRPEVTAFPISGFAYEKVKLRGKYFHPVLSKNAVFIEGVRAQITGGNTSELEVRIPDGPFPRKKAHISFKLLEYEVGWDNDFSLKDTWVMVNDRIPFRVYMPTGAVTLNNTAYVISGSRDYNDPKSYVWKFIPDTYSWQQIEIPFTFASGVVTASSDRIYLYTKGEKNNFWEYNPATNVWTKKADCISGPLNSPSIFHIGNSIYLGIGTISNMFSEEASYRFYKYDINQNEWIRVADYPKTFSSTNRKEAATFVLNNLAFVGCGASNTGMYDFYRYDPEANAWTRIADFPDARGYTASFVLNNKGYVVHGTSVGGSSTRNCYRYDSSTNTWTKMSDIGVSLLGAGGMERSFAFSLNGKAYSGGGNSSSSQYVLYETLEP